MGTVNVSLPESLKAFVDGQAAEQGYATSGEYVRELIRREQQRQELRTLLMAGAASDPGVPADDAYFDALRQRVGRGARE